MVQIIKRWGTKVEIKGKLHIKRGGDQIGPSFLVRTKREEEERRREKKEEEGGAKKGKELCMILFGKVMGISLSQT